MNESNTGFRRTAIGAICCVIALACLPLLTPEPDIANGKPQDSVRLAQERAASRVLGPGARTTENSVGDSIADGNFHSYFSDRGQRNDPLGSGIATLDEVLLTQQPSSAFDRFESISALGDSSDALAELTLVNLLYDQDPAIRESAIESLASLGTHGAIQGLGFALTDAHPLIRRAAIEFLADIGTPVALEAVAATLSDPEVDLRLAAVYELADNESEAASVLLQEFLSDADPSVRKVAAEFLND